MEYNLNNINLEEVTEEVKDQIFSNIDTINNLLKEVKNLRIGIDSITSQEQVSPNKNTKTKEEDTITEKENNDKLDEINYYYLRIKDIELTDNPESLELLKRELPSKRISNYQDIILGINSFLIKDINEIKYFLETEKDIITKEELEEFKKDIFDIRKKINAINYLSSNNTLEQETDLNDEPLNNIVFLETDSGNIYALEDLSNNTVPIDYYEGFYELIHSIEDGTFKNVGIYNSGNNKTAGISKVKGFKRRVIFDRVGYNTYVILGIFIKKSDKDTSYMGPLKNRIAKYRRIRDNIVEKVKQDEGYLDSQRQILEQIYNQLMPNKKKGSR